MDKDKNLRLYIFELVVQDHNLSFFDILKNETQNSKTSRAYSQSKRQLLFVSLI